MGVRVRFWVRVSFAGLGFGLGLGLGVGFWIGLWFGLGLGFWVVVSVRVQG